MGALIDKPRTLIFFATDFDSATNVPHSTSRTMADADEEAIRATSTEAPQIETDLSDETQDFRLLNHLNLYLPKAAMFSNFD